MSLAEVDNTTAAVCLRGVTRSFQWDGGDLAVLDCVDLDIDGGEAVALMGPSGSGKTTLLNLIGGLDRPTSGSITIFGRVLQDMTEAKLTAFRAQSIGMVFQDSHLLPGFSALDNVVLSRLPWRPIDQLRTEAGQLLVEVGLGSRLKHPPNRLSGGERQRVGIARALVGAPRLLLADEPTGNLDAATAASVVALLKALRVSRDLTLLVATHDPEVASIADRVIRMSGGRLNAPQTDVTRPR